ncbi:hypothetical protein [Pseudanabaena mucicola]|uniref:Uncharacterized protein n=1 Tax=Pseudanabaena mucicola FACHB-723 TaxID=2692860 RepID=A0ABR7ZVL5_9CYAN|nr:hypothetical protein [Pseudanabaena mucicola]MBD2187852.1 hypothetical protein [Pseudanabaena mucicola FACHB-723]
MKKFLSSIIASTICLSAAFPAFAGQTPIGGSTSNAPSYSRVKFSLPDGRDPYSIELPSEIVARLNEILPSFRNGSFGSRLQFVVNLIFPNTELSDTLVVDVNSLGNAITAFNEALTPEFLNSLTPEQIAQLNDLANILKRLREQVK